MDPYGDHEKPAEIPGLPTGHKLEPQFAPHLLAYKADPSPANADRYLKAVKPVIDNGVTAFGGRAPSPMTRSRAKSIALEAARTYDPLQAKLSTHLTNHLKGLQRYAAKQTQMLSVPERVAMDRQNLDEVEARLEDELGRPPSSAEVADKSGISVKRQAYVRLYKPGFAEGQVDALNAGDDGDGESSATGPAVVGADPLAQRIAFVYDDLDPISQRVVEHGFGLHGRPKLKVGEIARRLNLTPGAISQRTSKIQAMLDEVEDTGVL